jgi:hypothetical protein
MQKIVHAILTAIALCTCQAWAADKFTLKDLSRYEGVWKREFKDKEGKPHINYMLNQIDTNTALMRSVQLNLDPVSLEVGWSGAGWIGLSPSGENFHGLGFLSGGQVFEGVKTPKNGKFLNQTMGTGTNGSHFLFTGVEEFLSDTEIRVTEMNVTTNGTLKEQVREGNYKKTNRASVEDLVEHKELVFGNWGKNQPISQLAPMKRLLGHWQVKDSNGKEELHCHFRYVGNGRWLLESFKFPDGRAGLNVSGVDPLTGELALWSVGKNFMGKIGRWDELDKNVLGQVQGSSRLVREFPDAKTYKAHWQGLTKGSYVDSREKGYTAKLVEESK